MLSLEKIKVADTEIIPEFDYSWVELLFLEAIISKFYLNPVCFGGIFTGNDLDPFHDFFSKNSYKVHAYDNYPFLSAEDKITFQEYVLQRHSEKPYINFKWVDVSSSDEQYSFIYNTAGYRCDIHKLFKKQTSPCVLFNAKGSSWHIFEHNFKYVFRNSSYDIFVNNDLAYKMFLDVIKENYNKLRRLNFHIVKVGDTVFGDLRDTSNYKQFLKSLSSDITSYSV
jgi:hypothetical protein